MVTLGTLFASYPVRRSSNPSSAAFEVYVRRAYRAYSVLSIDYEEGDTLDDGEIPSVPHMAVQYWDNLTLLRRHRVSPHLGG